MKNAGNTEKYKSMIARVLKINQERLSIFKSDIKEGTKATIWRVHCENPPESGGGNDYILKIYNRPNAIDLSTSGIGSVKNDSAEEFLRERESLEVLHNYKTQGTVPAIMSYDDNEFNEKKAILMKTISAKTLESCMIKGSEENWGNIKKALSVFGKAMNALTEHSYKLEERIRTISNGDLGLKVRTTEHFIKNIELYSQITEKYNNSILNSFKSKFKKSLAYEYLDNPELKRLGPSDLYPSNITLDALIDFGTTGEFSIPLFLGCLIGHPAVYETLSYEPGEQGRIERKGRIHSLINYIGNYSEFDTKKVNKGIWTGGVYGTWRMAAGLIKKDNAPEKEVKRFMKAATEQAIIALEVESK